jgi:hypothetical protein
MLLDKVRVTKEKAMRRVGVGLVVIFLAMLLNGCASTIGDADAGPDPGGGFYDGSNMNVGHINPVHGGFSYDAYTNLGQASW